MQNKHKQFYAKEILNFVILQGYFRNKITKVCYLWKVYYNTVYV